MDLEQGGRDKMCTNYIESKEVLIKVDKKRNLVKNVRWNKANWIGHAVREDGLFKQILEGMMKGERKIGRIIIKQRRSYENIISED